MNEFIVDPIIYCKRLKLAGAAAIQQHICAVTLLLFYCRRCCGPLVLVISAAGYVLCGHPMLDVVSLLSGSNRNSYVVQGTDGPRPMAIFELLDYIVNEVCCVP